MKFLLFKQVNLPHWGNRMCTLSLEEYYRNKKEVNAKFPRNA